MIRILFACFFLLCRLRVWLFPYLFVFFTQCVRYVKAEIRWFFFAFFSFDFLLSFYSINSSTYTSIQKVVFSVLFCRFFFFSILKVLKLNFNSESQLIADPIRNDREWQNWKEKNHLLTLQKYSMKWERIGAKIEFFIGWSSTWHFQITPFRFDKFNALFEIIERRRMNAFDRLTKEQKHKKKKITLNRHQKFKAPTFIRISNENKLY